MSEYIQSESDIKFVSNITEKSKNIVVDQISKTMLNCRCLVCGETFLVKGFHKLNKIMCPICKERNRLKKQKERIDNDKKEWDNSDDSSVRRVCDIYDGCIRRGGNLCKSCILKVKPFYSKQELREIVSKANPSIELITDEYFSGRTVLAKYRCKECGSISDGSISELMRGHMGCNECNHSIGESKVKAWLVQNSIDFESEKSFDGCKDKRELRFDFFLPKHNAVIEFDGRQHFVPTAFHLYEDSESNFRGQRRRDKIKDAFCMKNNIPILRIRYDDKDINKTLSCFIREISSINVTLSAPNL